MTMRSDRCVLPPAPPPTPPLNRWRPWTCYGLALLLTLATLLLRQSVLVPFAERPLFILFMLPIIVSALLGGSGPGLTATLAATACTELILMPPADSFAITASYDALQWGVLIMLANGILVSLLSESLHRSWRHDATRWLQLTSTQHQLRQSESLFQATFEQAALGIALVAPNGRWLRANRKLCEIVGYSEEELLERTLQDITHPDDLAADLDYVRRMLAGEIQTYSMEKRYLRKDGDHIWVHLTASLVRGADAAQNYFISVVENIQARKQAEAALHRKDAELRLHEAVLVNIAEGVNVVSPQDMHILYTNTRFDDMFGYQPGELAGQPVAILNAAETTAAAISDELHASGIWRGELLSKRKDGSHFWSQASVSTLELPQWGIVWLTVQSDISERKRAELALRESEQRFRKLFDLAPIPLAIVSQNGTILAINGRFVSTFGYSHADIPALADWWPLAYPDPDYRRAVIDAWNAAVQRALEQNADIVPLELRITGKNGEVRTVVISGIMTNTDCLVTLFDITERRAAEDALRARERYLRALLDNFPFMVWLKDTDGRILAANQVFAQVAGAANTDELIGKTDFDYWEAELAEHYRADDRSVLASGQPKAVEEEITQAGRRFWIETYKSPVEFDGSLIGTVGFARDISERKDAEAELYRRNDELERFNRAMIGREQDMIELKQQVNELSRRLGQEPPYPLAFLHAPPASPQGGEAP